jgi:hypothetical protein
MNCGSCEGCKAKRRECETFTLHKFRRSYITTLLRNGIDLRTVQAYAGHKDIASTMRYLRPASAKEAQGSRKLWIIGLIVVCSYYWTLCPAQLGCPHPLPGDKQCAPSLTAEGNR